MDCPAALHRLVVGVPATVEHSAEAGAGEGEEIGKWVAETTQVGRCPRLLMSVCCPSANLGAFASNLVTIVIYHLHGRPKTKPPSQRPAPPLPL